MEHIERALKTKMYGHFSEIASSYSSVRIMDSEPVAFIASKIKDARTTRIADIGCGDGRYSIRLAESSPSLSISCVDDNQGMIDQLNDTLNTKKILPVQTFKGSAEKIPLDKESQDIVTTFNAIHHFEIPAFAKEVSRILKNRGKCFVYTRLDKQNRQNLWGRYFPLFNSKETRLYGLDTLVSLFSATPSLKIDSVKFFRYRRISTLDNIIKKVRLRHYSTFSMYSEDELRQSLDKFKQNMLDNFPDSEKIQWRDENTMLVFCKENSD